MELSKLKKSFRTLKSNENRSQIVTIGLTIMLGVSLFLNLQKDTIVIHAVNPSCSESIISSNSMNKANHEKLGFFLATVLGNITPDTAKYADAAVMEYISPSIYNDVKNAIATQTQDLVIDELTMDFFPERAFVESGKTFVTGKGRLTGPTGSQEKYIRTYEFRFEVQNYTPSVTYLNVYNDVPHDLKWKQKNIKDEK
mgnify:CR=1 FL=1